MALGLTRYDLPGEQGYMEMLPREEPEYGPARGVGIESPASVGLAARADEQDRQRQAFAIAEREKSQLGLIPATSPELKANRRQHLIRQAAKHGVPQNVLANQIQIEGLQEEIAAPPPKEVIPKTLEAALARRVYNKEITFEEAQKQMTAIKGKGAGKEFERAGKLRSQFLAGSKDFIKVRDAFARVQASAQDPSAAGDMALVFNYMKILDPGSTVREGEFATAKNAAGIPERMRAHYNNAIDGKLLGDTQRKDFVNRAGMLFTKQGKSHKKRVGEYTRLAKRFELSPEDVIIDLTDPETLAQAGLTAEEGAAAAEDIATEARGENTLTVTNPTTGKQEVWDLTTEKRIS
jgi:hypothetical protein